MRACRGVMLSSIRLPAPRQSAHYWKRILKELLANRCDLSARESALQRPGMRRFVAAGAIDKIRSKFAEECARALCAIYRFVR